MMRVDIREHAPIRNDIRHALKTLLVQGRQIWGDTRHPLDDIVPRLMVGVGDIARLLRDDGPTWESELKKELGNILFSTIRWIDDLGLDPLKCLDLAITAQEEFAKSGRPR